jgi:histidine triad (HIT) family protein
LFAKNSLPLQIVRGLIVRCGNETLSDMTIFEKIIARQIPAKIIWEDDDVVAFHDVDPQAPVHVLIVPKKAVPRLTDATDDDRALLGKLLLVARDLAKEFGLSSGYRVVINCGPDAGESVPHLHVHLLGKRALAWPPG